MKLAVLVIAAAASAVLADPRQEERAEALDSEIRCVQCQNEPIAQSTADIAADMRALVRERIRAGDSDTQIRDYFRRRYGDFVLFRPPWDARTWALWTAPVFLLLAGLGALLSLRRGVSPGESFEPEDGER